MNTASAAQSDNTIGLQLLGLRQTLPLVSQTDHEAYRNCLNALASESTRVEDSYVQRFGNNPRLGREQDLIRLSELFPLPGQSTDAATPSLSYHLCFSLLRRMIEREPVFEKMSDAHRQIILDAAIGPSYTPPDAGLVERLRAVRALRDQDLVEPLMEAIVPGVLPGIQRFKAITRDEFERTWKFHHPGFRETISYGFWPAIKSLEALSMVYVNRCRGTDDGSIERTPWARLPRWEIIEDRLKRGGQDRVCSFLEESCVNAMDLNQRSRGDLLMSPQERDEIIRRTGPSS